MFPVQKLYHATRAENLDSIMREGLKTSFHGAVHGGMEYEPAGPSVYLSRHEDSSNLNSNLFVSEDGHPASVVILEIDPSLLDPDLVYPDDSMLHMMDEEVLADWEDIDDADRVKTSSAFARKYGISQKVADKIINDCLEQGEDRYPHILKQMWREFLVVEGEVAYMADIPAAAIVAVRDYGQDHRRDEVTDHPGFDHP